MQLPEKLETFSWFLITVLESPVNFEDFERKDEPHSLSAYEVIHSEKCVYLQI